MFKASLTYKRMISFTTAMVVGFSSIASATEQAVKYSTGDYAQKFEQTKTHNLSESEKNRLTQDKDMLEKMGYSVKVDTKSKMATVFDPNNGNKPVMEFPFADEGTLRKFSPKSLNVMLMEEMRKVNAANKQAFSHSLKNLPTESAIFFMAMGAVVASQLISNYSQNPQAMKQHVDHSLSPLGVFGFYTFMYSQGVTSNVLAMYIKNPKFHHMIPYLGMSVGMFVQSYLSQILMDPNVSACAKTMMGQKVTEKDTQAGVDKDPCSKAYDYLVIQKKIWEFAPGMASMIASSAVAAVGQSLVSKAVLRVTGFDMATLFIPGGMQVKGIRLLLVKGLQITAFIAIDHWMVSRVTYAWKNVFDGRELGTIGNDLETGVNDQIKSQWKAEDKDLQANMKLFRDKMSAWRMMNLSQVYEAHQNWSDSLTQMTSMYNSSHSFYRDFIHQVKLAKTGQTNVKPLERLTPFYGVKMNLDKEQQDFVLSEPSFIENKQYETISAVASEAKSILESKEYARFMPKEKATLKKIIDGLNTPEIKPIGDALVLLNSELRATAQNVSASQGYYYILYTLYNSMGTPTPMLEKGRGWVNAYGDAPSTAENLKGSSYYRKVGLFATPKITDYMIMQMICGPDVEQGEQVLKNSLGYPSVFLPPTIRNQNDEFDECDGIKADAGVARIYNWPVKAASGKYEGFVSYLAAETRASILGTGEDSNFDDWWKKNTEAQMQKAFAKFSESYQEIVIKMVRGIYKPGRSSLNQGPIYNGTMNSIFQEERVYLSMLNTLLNPSAKYVMNLENNMTQAPTEPLLKEIENQFAIMNAMLKKIRIVTIEGKERIDSPLENYQLDDQLKNIQNALAKVSEKLGVGDKETAASQALSKSQRDFAVTTLESLQGVASEMLMYGVMANAVSWDKINNLKKISIEQDKYNNEIQKKLAQMRSLTAGAK